MKSRVVLNGFLLLVFFEYIYVHDAKLPLSFLGVCMGLPIPWLYFHAAFRSICYVVLSEFFRKVHVGYGGHRGNH